MGSLSNLLNNGGEDGAEKSKQARTENSLGQMMANSNPAASSGTSADLEADALRDLFAPNTSGDAAAATATGAAAPSNGKNSTHEEMPDALTAVAAESAQPVVAQTAEPVSRGLGGLIRTPNSSPTAASPAARGTEGGVSSDAVTESAGAAAAASGAGASSLSSVLAKASTNTAAGNKFLGGSRGTPISTGALSPLSVPSVDRGNSLLKPEEPYDPADLHKIGAIGSIGTTGGGKGDTDTSEIVGAASAINAAHVKSMPEALANVEALERKAAAEAEGEARAEAEEAKPVAKSTSAFAHLVAPATKKDPEAIAETLDVESSNERVDSIADRHPAEVAGATAPAMPTPTPPAAIPIQAPAAAAASTVGSTPPAMSATLNDMVPAEAITAPLNSTLREMMSGTAESSTVNPTLREMQPMANSPAPQQASAISKLARKPAPLADPASATARAQVVPPSAPLPSAPLAPPIAQSAAQLPAATSATVAAPTANSPAAAAPAAAPAVPAPAPAPAPAGQSQAAPIDNVKTSSESAETKTEVKEALGTALNRLAESYYQQGNYPEAQGLYEKILSLKQQQIGAKNPALGSDLTNLAGVLCVQGKFAQAEPFVRRVVSLIETTEPVDVLKLAGSINTLAGILFQQGKLEECEPLLGRALQLRREFLGEDVMEVADSLRDYAKLLKKLGRIEEAEKHYLQAKAIVAKRQQAAMTPPA
jgi:Tfp pilus assembly protein PilF